MIKALLSALLVGCFAASPQYISTSGGGQPGYSAACTAPTMTYRYAAYNSSNACGTTGGSSCTTNGQAAYSAADFVAGNTATEATTARQAVYNTNEINGLPAWTFSDAVAGTGFVMGTAIPSSISAFTMYAVMEFPTAHAGALLSNTPGGAIEWRINSGNNMQLEVNETLNIGASTQNLSTNTWYTVVVTYNTVSGAYAFYNASGGTLTAEGSGTNAQSFTQPTAIIGNAGFGTSDYYNGQIAEIGFLNSVNTTGIAAWSKCEYGL